MVLAGDATAPSIAITLLAPREDGTVLVMDPSTGRASGIAHGATLPGWVMTVDDEDHVLASACRELRVRFGLDAPALEIQFSEDAMARTPVLLVVDRLPPGTAAPAGLTWRGMEGIGASAFPPELAERGIAWLRELRGETEVPAARQPWARPGSQQRLTAWLDAGLAALGRPRTGPLQQVSCWGISMVLRAETVAGPIWVKSAMSPFAAELGVTRLLAGRFPEAVPSLLAVNESEGWLAMEDLGSTVLDEADLEGRRAASDLLAHIQHELAGEVAALRGAGAAGSHLDHLPAELEDAFFGGPSVVTWALLPDRHRELVGLLRADVACVVELGVPDSLVHGDFSPWNVAVRDGRTVIFDWADASVGFPLIDLATWLNGIEDEPTRERIWRDWAAAWSDVVPAEWLLPRYPQVLRVGDAHHLVANVRGLRALEPAARPAMIHTATDFERELDRAARLAPNSNGVSAPE